MWRDGGKASPADGGSIEGESVGGESVGGMGAREPAGRGDIVRAFGFGITAAAAWGLCTVGIEFANDTIGSIEIAIGRLLVAIPLLAAIVRIRSDRLRLAHYDGSFWIAVVGLTANALLFTIGLETAPSAHAAILESTAPFYLMILLVLLGHERFSFIAAIAVALTIAGVAVTMADHGRLGVLGVTGDYFEIAAGVTVALFFFGSSRYLRHGADTTERLRFLVNVFAASAALLAPTLLFVDVNTELTALASVAALGVIGTALPFLLWYEAASVLSPLTASLLFTLSVVFAGGFAYLLLAEPITVPMLVGAAMVTAGVVLCEAATRPQPVRAGARGLPASR